MSNNRAGLLGQVGQESFSLREAVGGPLGVVESLAPGTLFITVFLITGRIGLALACAGAVVSALAVVRLAKRSTLKGIFSGFVGLAVGVVWAYRTGKAEDVYLPSILINAAYGSVVALSALVRWPILGVMLGLLHGRPLGWYKTASPGFKRAATIATWLWVAVFALRLAVKVPLYLSGSTGTLGVFHLLLGLPLFALAAWGSWLLLSRWAKEAAQSSDGVEAGVGESAGTDDE
ncbi:MAG: DUF3159 domain-containing protein [Buchananella hordeovulneris]|nr:DUF3159 domain-containing protein [Buchananella hordeovulneris]